MNTQLMFTYLLVFLFCSLTIFISIKLYENYRLKYLLFYMGYIIVHNILGFFSLFGTYLYDMLRPSMNEPPGFVGELLYLLILPLIPVSLFLYLNFAAEILDTQLSNRLKKIFIILWAFFILLYLLIIGRVFLTPSESLVSLVLWMVYLLEGIVFYLANLFLVFKALKIKDKTWKRTIQYIGFFYLGVLSVYVIAFLHIIILSHFSFLVLHFGYNIPPLIFLFFYLKKSNFGVSMPIGQEENLKNFFKQHSITPRESEIILMLLSGSKNKDIGKELFISYHTVKNHIHKIYQKLDVRNRLQMYSTIKNHIQKG
jgi:DNA-binding CsgD family transcriptional regulator